MKHNILHNTVKFTLALVALLAFSAGRASAQQEPTLDDSDTIRVTTNLVNVSVQVTDSKGRAVAFDAKQLKIYADGVPQETAFSYTNASDPTTVVTLLVDISDSMRGRAAQRCRLLINELVKAASPSNRYILYVFSDHTTRVGEFAGDEAGRRALMKALEAQKYGGRTPLYSAARQIIKEARATQHKSAIMVFTDGSDNASLVNGKLSDSDEALDFDSFGGFACAFLIYPDLLRSDGIYMPKSETDRVAAQVKKYIGGETYVARGTDGNVESIARRAAESLTLSVELAFYPTSDAASHGIHSLKVMSLTPTDLHIRSRMRYVVE